MTDRLNLTEAAAFTGRHRNTLRGWIRTGRLTTASKASGAWTIERAELEALAPKPAEPAAAVAPQGFELVPAGTLERLIGIAAAYAETGERVGRAEAMADTYRERLAEARQELAELRDRIEGRPLPPPEAAEVKAPPRPPGELVSRFSGLLRRIRR